MQLERASRTQVKFIQSLKLKKNRQKYGVFVAEGRKVVDEILRDGLLEISYLFATEEWLTSHSHLLIDDINTFVLDEPQLRQASVFKIPDQVILICKCPPEQMLESCGWTLYLDRINDPGNLGTIVRTADWFGLKQLYMAPGTVDLFNPKVIQAGMGSIGRISYCYTSFDSLKIQYPELEVYISDTKGVPIKNFVNRPGIIVIGNESHGVSRDIAHSNQANLVTIPRGKHGRAESLNAAVATAGLLAVLFS